MSRFIRVRTSTGIISVDVRRQKVDNYHTEYSLTTTVGDHDRVSENFTVPLNPSVRSESIKIWKKYESTHRGNFVIRSGMGLCGCYDTYDPNAAPNPHRQESDSEHACGCVELVNDLELFYPQLLTTTDYARIRTLLKNHDLGENTSGDRPDDGSQDITDKTLTELHEFAKSIIHLPARPRTVLLKDFMRFQDPLFDGYDPDDARIVQLAHVIDKVEAVLSILIYEKSGAGGSLEYKRAHYGITAQDQHFIDATGGDSLIAATWFAHACTHCHTCYGFPYLLDVVKAAVTDVRGAWFPWFDTFCTNHDIPPEHLSIPPPPYDLRP